MITATWSKLISIYCLYGMFDTPVFLLIPSARELHVQQLVNDISNNRTRLKLLFSYDLERLCKLPELFLSSFKVKADVLLSAIV